VPGSEHQIWYWAFAANWSEVFGKGASALPHMWSLSVEEQFYFAWPFVVRSMKPRSLAMLCFALVNVALLSRVVFRSAISPDAAYMFTICRADALALGALAAVAIRESSLRRVIVNQRALLRWYGVGMLFVTLLITKGASRTGLLSQSAGYTLFALAFTLIVVAAAPATDADGGIEVSRPLKTIGKYSYAMYMFHMPVHLLIGAPLVAKLTGVPADGTHGIPFALAYLIGASLLTFGCAFVSYHALEKHFTRQA
jgi:peptidoglycan/LPS O-acetylase OafA/YrhL